MAASDYCTLSDLKSSLSLTGTSFADGDLQNAIDAASRAIDERCGRRFYLDADANQVRKFWPINPGYCAIDDLVTFTSLVAQDSTWTIDQDFYLEPTNAGADGRPYTAIRTIARPFIFTQSTTPPGWAGFDGRITVTGQWGWPSVPPQIAEATRIWATRILRRVREAPFGVIEGGADTGVIRLGRIDPDVAALVDPFAIAILY